MLLRRVLISVGLLVVAGRLLAVDDLKTARELFDAKKYVEARAMLDRLVVAEPKNAEVRYSLALACKQTHTVAAYEEALKWLAQAVELEPANASYLSDYGGTSLELAGMIHGASFTQ